MPKMTNIIVGCGGSGAKTAFELAEIMGQDPQWRHEMDENVYFMLIDTDQGDLDKYADLLRKSAPSVHVETILSTEGFNTVGEILAEFTPGLKTGTADEKRAAFERFREHWWFEHPNNPDVESANMFRAQTVARIKSGAGQVPMVSFLAAWHAMERNLKTPKSIGDRLDNLCTEIANRRVGIQFGGSNPLGDFNIFFLGSVAGGTGRGCMIPVAFKLKEVFFRRFNSVPFISGYFLDESCFRAGRERHEELPQQINSMTGWSELSAWLSYYAAGAATGHRHRDFTYSLPGTSRTGEPSFDVLRSPLATVGSENETIQHQDGLRRDRARLPFDAVAVIGHESSSGFRTGKPDEVYQMVATGLYCRLTQSIVDSKLSNDGRTYFSIGSAIAEIPCHDLQEFFDAKARMDVATAIQRAISEDDASREAANLLEWLGMGNPLPALLGEPVEGEPENALQLLVREWFATNREGDLELNKLVAALNDQDLEQSKAVIDEILSENRLDDPLFVATVGKAFVKQFTAFQRTRGVEIRSADELVKVIIDSLIGPVESSALERHGSVAAVAAIARRLDIMLADLVENTFSKRAIEAWINEPIHNFKNPNACGALDQAKGREGFGGVFGKRFNDQEISHIREETQRELQILYARALGKWLLCPASEGAGGGLLGLLRPKLAVLRSNAHIISQCASYCLEESGLTARSLKSTQNKLFAPDELVDALAMSNGSADYHIRRTIRPVMPDEADLRLHNPNTLAVARGALGETVLTGDAADNPALKTALRESFRAAKYLLKDQHAGETILSAFELAPVLRDLQRKWRVYLQAEKNKGEDRFQETAQKFRNYFGIDPKVVGSTVQITGGDKFESIGGNDTLLLGMACVCARTCRPFWRTRGGAARQPRVTVQLPVHLGDTMVPQWSKKIQDEANIANAGNNAVTVLDNPEKKERMHNPYVLVVYNSEGAADLGDVLTLDSWSRDAQLRLALIRAESMDKPMPFATPAEMWEGYRGSGFSEPSYVFNPLLRQYRWRPWMSAESEDEDMAAAASLEMAVVYACWGAGWLLEAALGPDDAARALGESKWPAGPLFEEGERKTFKLGRLPCTIAETGTAVVNAAPIIINLGETITQSIRTLPEVLRGRKPARNHKGAAADLLLPLRTAVLAEYEAFFDKMAHEYGFHAKSGKHAHLRLLEAMMARALQARQDAGNGENTDRDFWQGLVDELDRRKKLA